MKKFLFALLLIAGQAFGAGTVLKTIGDYSYQNYLINGAMDFAQRGAGPTNLAATSGTYYLDRWTSWYGGTCAATPTIQQTASYPTGAPSSYVAATSSNATNSTCAIAHAQRIESSNARNLINKPVTVSFWVYTESANQIYIAVLRANALNNFSTTTTIDSITKSIIVGSWQKVVWTVPQATMNVDELRYGAQVSIAFTNMTVTGTAKLHYLTQVQLNEGPTAAPFRLAGGTIGGELALAQRYYEKSFAVSVAPAGNLGYRASVCGKAGVTSDTTVIANPVYKVTKRLSTMNAITYYNPASGTANYGTSWRIGTSHAPSTYSQDDTGFIISYGTIATAGDNICVHWTADAEL